MKPLTAASPRRCIVTAAALGLSLSSCDALWSFTRVNNRDNCVINPGICRPTQICSPEIELCVERMPVDGGMPPADFAGSPGDAAGSRCSGTFQMPYNLPTFGTPREVLPISTLGVAVADFNGDGYDDLAIGRPTVPEVVVLIGDGQGGFASMRTTGTALPLSYLRAIDLNRDGKLELVGLNYTGGTVSILHGKGDGTFGFLATSDTYSIGGPHGYTFSDFDSDGKLDMVAFADASPGLFFFPGNGDGTLGRSPVGIVGAPFGIAGIQAAEITGDGRDELILAETNGFVRTYAYGGGSMFTQLAYRVAGSGLVDLRVADLDKDQIPEAVVLSGLTREVIVLKGHKDGSFDAPLPIGMGDALQDLAVSDLNGDGRNDVVVASTGPLPALRWFSNNGALTFTVGSVALPGSPTPVLVGDLNCDGKPDLVTVTGSQVLLMLNLGR